MSKLRELYWIGLYMILLLATHLLLNYALNKVADKITNPPYSIIKIY